jgi:hypothetical protein
MPTLIHSIEKDQGRYFSAGERDPALAYCP